MHDKSLTAVTRNYNVHTTHGFIHNLTHPLTMRYPKTILIAATSVILASSAAVAMAASPGSMTPLATTMTELMSSVPHAIHDAIIGTFKDDDAASTQTSVAPADETPTSVQQEQAQATVRGFMKSATLDLRYAMSSSNPYKENGPRLDIYVDNQGNDYWVEKSSNRLIQMGPAPSADQVPQPDRSQTRKSVSVLREAALAMAEQFPGIRNYPQLAPPTRRQ